MFFTAEVIETKYAYKTNQKDDKGKVLPLGSILLKTNSNSIQGQVNNFFARPHDFNKRIPFIGEHVLVCQGPIHDSTQSNKVSTGFLYLSAYNVTDDVSLNHFPKLWERSKHHDGGSPTIKSDKKEIGYNYSKPSDLKKVDRLQPFEGDHILEGRFGQSLRFGTTISKDTGIYSEKPTWKGSTNGDPIVILRINKPSGGSHSLIDTNSLFSNPAQSKYSVEDIDKDSASIYLTTSQKLEKLKPGFSKNKEAKDIGKYQAGTQIILNADRIVINSKKDKTILIGNSELISTAKKIILQSDKHKVDLDDLMEYIKSLTKELFDLTTGSKQFLTSMGPTSTATNMASVTKLYNSTFNQKFKKP